MRRSTVLLVDDNRANLVALDAVLGNEHDLVYAESGQQAIDLVRTRGDIDLILMDVQMPTMDGFEAALRIREIPERRDIPIAFITAIYSDDPSVRRGYEVGGIDYFSKPFDPSLLRRKVAAYVAMRRFERERWSNVHIGVLVTSGDGTVIQMNDAAVRLLSGGRSDPGSAEHEALRAILSHAVGEGRIESASGTLQLHVSALHGSDGARTGAVFLFQRT